MIRRRVAIANRGRLGPWHLVWKVPCALAIWLVWAAPIAAGVLAIATLRDYARDLPRAPALSRWADAAPRTSVLVAADGTVVADIPFDDGEAMGHRRVVPLSELPPVLVHAILAAEDVRFFQHDGVDPQAVVRAALANYRAGTIVEGASTITQQVARNLLPETIGNERSLRRKVREALLARRIERLYSKQQILETYANHAFLGQGAYGVAAAARAYFDKPLAELSLAEAALIAGMAQAPGRANPYRNPDAARRRRDQVLERMARAGFAETDAAERAAAEPIELRPPPVRYGTVAPWHTERARRDIETASPDAYRRGGLTVETSAQPALAAELERTAGDHAERLARAAGDADGAEPPQLAAVLVDHQTGYVEGAVGGLSWKRSQFDRGTMACRQPGSAFKPIVYGAAIEHDVITPGTPLRDAPIAEYDERLDVHWKPTNSGREFRGVALAQDALAASLNAPAVDVFDRVGADRVIAFASALGITSELDPVRPLALGASCVLPVELAAAYAAFPRGGRALEPIYVVRVRRAGEVVLDRASPVDPTLRPARRLDRWVASAPDLARTSDPTVSPETAFLMTRMLRAVITRGTATAARDLGRPAAGKTGTTNENTDAWFVGFTARITAAVWIGHDDPSRPLGRRQDGSHAALPLWERAVRLAEAGRPPQPLTGPPPPGLIQRRVDRETGLLAAPGAGGALELYFKSGTEPTGTAGHTRGVPTTMKRITREF